MSTSRKFLKCLLGFVIALAFAAPATAQNELYKIAESLASPTFPSFEAARDGLEDDAVMLRQEMAYQQLTRFTSNNALLDEFRRNRLAELAACSHSLRTLRSLDSNVPDYEGVVTKTLAASPAIYKAARANLDGEQATYNQYDRESISDLAEKALSEVISAGYNAYQASEERTNYRNLYQTARKNSLSLENIVRGQVNSPPLTSYGMGLIAEFANDGATVIVSSLLDNSPAKEAGLLPGDQLISADGKSLSLDTFQEVMGVRQTLQTSPLELVARRDGKNYSFSVRRSMPIILPLLSVDVNGAFDGFYSSDEVYVTNSSGHDLTNVIFFVDLKGKHGEHAREVGEQHMHFVQNWPNGETRVLRYLSTAKSGVASDESVDQIMNVQFRLYSDQFSQTQNYNYSADDFAEDVQRYLADLKFTAKWHSYSDDHLFYNSGVAIKTADGSSFPALNMTLTVKSGSTSKSFKYDIEGDVFDGDEYFSHRDFNGMSVDRIDISFALPYTSHPVEASWEFNNFWAF